jgi:peptidoglycan/xylan/chitin deacetylase (PgdA/CDA1 family)
MFTESLIIVPILCLIYYEYIQWYIGLIVLSTMYWIPKFIIIKTLNKLYPDILTHRDYSCSFGSYSKPISLTFDDVPYEGGFENTNKIVKILDKYKMKGTFFVISDYVKTQKHRNLLVQMVKSGHQLGNHGKTNSMHALLSREKLIVEMDTCDRLIREIYSEANRTWLLNTMVYRPGCGLFHKGMIELCKEKNYRLALGSVYPNDPIVQSSMINYYYLINHIEAGDIVILHDRAWTPDLLEKLMTYLVENKFRSVTLDIQFGTILE